MFYKKIGLALFFTLFLTLPTFMWQQIITAKFTDRATKNPISNQAALAQTNPVPQNTQ